MSPCSTGVLLWIAIHIGRRPWPNVYFTVRGILFCRRFKPNDSYKQTSPRGPEAKHLRPRRTPINGVYTQPEDCLSHSPFPQVYVRAAAERSLSGTPTPLLRVVRPREGQRRRKRTNGGGEGGGRQRQRQRQDNNVAREREKKRERARDCSSASAREIEREVEREREGDRDQV